MLNIIKAQLFGIRRDVYTYGALLIIAGMLMMMVMDTLTEHTGTVITGSQMASGLLELGVTLALYIIVMVATRICGWDFNDKTINYEVLYGHHRRQVYWGRVLVAVPLSTLLVYAALVVPVLVFRALHGWGNVLPEQEFLVRCGLLIFPLLRMVSIVILLSILLRNSWASLVAGMLVLMAEMFPAMLVMHGEISNKLLADYGPFVLTSHSLMTVCNFSHFSTEQNPAYLFTDTLSSGTVQGTVLCGIALTVLYLIAGRVLFGRRDMQ